MFAAAGGTGKVGPSLDARKLTPAQVTKIVHDGAPGMPGYENRIGPHDLKLLADYVSTRSRAR